MKQIKEDIPISSEGFLSLKCSHTRINVSVFSGVGHSPCLINIGTHRLGESFGERKGGGIKEGKSNYFSGIFEVKNSILKERRQLTLYTGALCI